MKFLNPKLIELADEFVERCEEFPREPEGYRRYDAAEVARTRMLQIPLDHARQAWNKKWYKLKRQVV